MTKKPLPLFFALYSILGGAYAHAADISPKMVSEVRSQFVKIVEESDKGHVSAQRIFDVANEKAKLCLDAACAYTSYVDGIYEAVESIGSARRCPLSARALGGVWVNTADSGYYEKITLSLYKGRPSVHQFIAFKSKEGKKVEDGFGGWAWHACKVKTIERTSSGGRIFNPGNELTVLSYSKQGKVLTLLDGDFLASFVRRE
jgi:hypothetical protein